MKRFFFLIFILLLVVCVAPIGFVFMAMEPQPIVTQRLASTAKDAARTKEIIRQIRVLTDTGSDKKLRISEADMNGILAFGMRAVPSLRGQARVTSEAVWLKAAADLRRIPGGSWLNLQTLIKPSDRELKLEAMRVGPYNLPASIVLPSLGFALDLALGDGFGHMAVNGVKSVEIQQRAALIGIGLTGDQRKALAERTKRTMRVAAGLSSPEQVRHYQQAMAKAVNDGQLSGSGSVVAFIRFAMAEAHKRTTPNTGPQEIKAALLALAIYCGHSKFQTLIGGAESASGSARKTACAKTTLRGRGDLRQHFTISAGLKAAGDGTVAFAIGEFKELLDSNRGGSGFSFDDLAADRAGIRFAEAFLTASPGRREKMLSTMSAESALLPRVNDLASGMSEQEFKRRFGDVNNAAYQEMVAKIDGRIDRLPVFATP